MRSVAVGPGEMEHRFIPYGLDYAAVLAYADAAGAINSLLLDVLPHAEAAITAGARGGTPEEPGPEAEEGEPS